MINLDDFHNPKKVRYAGENEAENYFQRSFNIETIVQEFLVLIRQNVSYETNLTLLDLNSDKYEVRKHYSCDQSTIVLFEGVFLFRPELAPYINYKVFLDISFEELRRRA